ncbi:hypothetical protein B0H34DRAFT_706220 [Crassisporium funariophilum]|nr:hypothetical protein B0H34DRAFT_706220 [Crassisporium funariophilum]
MSPFSEVDMEVQYICRMAKQWIKSWRNPCAVANWFHLILVSCHPFEDGNGRLMRILASIPLMQQGYHPISIPMGADYYTGISKAHEGNRTALTQCILLDMQETLKRYNPCDSHCLLLSLLFRRLIRHVITYS